jgi:DNA-binding transcriptional LysR family regulator
MNLANLDLDTLRTLVVANDLGGYAQAADRLGRTPSAISLQMKRLQDDLGAQLFRKKGRTLALTEAGETAIRYARRILALNDELLDTLQGTTLSGLIRLGCSQDFSSILPAVLSQFAALYPRMQIELRIEGNAVLLEALEKGQIDLALAIGHETRPTAQTIGKLDIVWIAARNFIAPPGLPLSLAVLGPQCVFRIGAIQQLDQINAPYRIAATSPSLNGLWAALLGGLGITARTALGLPQDLIFGKSLFGLPPLGTLPITLHKQPGTKAAAVERMSTLLTEALIFSLQPQPKPKTLRLIPKR